MLCNAGALQQSGLPKFVKSAGLLAARLLVATFVLWSGATQAHLLRLQHSNFVVGCYAHCVLLVANATCN